MLFSSFLFSVPPQHCDTYHIWSITAKMFPVIFNWESIVKSAICLLSSLLLWLGERLGGGRCRVWFSFSGHVLPRMAFNGSWRDGSEFICTELFQSFLMISQEGKTKIELASFIEFQAVKCKKRRKAIVANYEEKVVEDTIQRRMMSLRWQLRQAAVFNAGSLHCCSDSSLAYADITPLTLISSWNSW